MSNIPALHIPASKIQRTTNQSIAGAETIISFPTTVFDDDQIASSNRFTPRLSARYQAFLRVAVDGVGGAGQYWLRCKIGLATGAAPLGVDLGYSMVIHNKDAFTKYQECTSEIFIPDPSINWIVATLEHNYGAARNIIKASFSIQRLGW
jgi:hypothetical protein